MSEIIKHAINAMTPPRMRVDTLSIQISRLHQTGDTAEQVNRINACRARAYKLRCQRDELMQLAARLYSVAAKHVDPDDPNRSIVDAAEDIIRDIAGDPA